MDYKEVNIVGAGGVGFWVAVALRRDFPDMYIVVWDSDYVDGPGGLRLPIPERLTQTRPETDSGDRSCPLKVKTLNDFLKYTLDTRPVIASMADYLGGVSGNFSTYFENRYFVDCTDMTVINRDKVFAAAINNNRYMRISYDGTGWVSVSQGLPLGDPTASGYLHVPSFAMSIAAGGIGATAVAQWVMDGKPPAEYQINLKTAEAMSSYEGVV